MRLADFDQPQQAFEKRSMDGHDCFVPPLLPIDIPYTAEIVLRLSKADQALSELSGAGRQMRNPHLLITPYLVQEAVQSTRIEGTQVTFEEMLIQRNLDVPEGAPRSVDIREVSNYVAALELGIERLANVPVLSLNLILDLHAQLLAGVGSARGRFASPGQFRSIQNYIGPDGTSVEEAEFVPPPPEQLMTLLSNWESFANRESERFPDLIACAILHAQFETIHPFIDGNGRMGRLMITLFLIMKGRIPSPLLYLSAYFEKRRQRYYRLLQGTRTEGNWLTWISFFLVGVESVADSAVGQIKGLQDFEAVTTSTLLGEDRRALRTAADLVPFLVANPFMTVNGAKNLLKVSYPTARAAVRQLEERGLLSPVNDQRWNRQYVCRHVLGILHQNVA